MLKKIGIFYYSTPNFFYHQIFSVLSEAILNNIGILKLMVDYALKERNACIISEVQL